MLITLPLRAAICKSVAEVLLTGAAPLGTVSHRFNLFKYKSVPMNIIIITFIISVATSH